MPRKRKLRGLALKRKRERERAAQQAGNETNIMRTPTSALRDLRAARRRQAEAIKRAGG